LQAEINELKEKLQKKKSKKFFLNKETKIKEIETDIQKKEKELEKLKIQIENKEKQLAESQIDQLEARTQQFPYNFK